MPKQGAAGKALGKKNIQSILHGVAAMNDHRQVKLAGKLKLSAENAVLQFFRLLVPVVIKADFTHGLKARVRGKNFAQPRVRFLRPQIRVNGMDAENEKQLRVAGQALVGFVPLLQRSEHIADKGNPAGPRAGDHLVKIGGEALIVKMGVAIRAAGGQVKALR